MQIYVPSRHAWDPSYCTPLLPPDPSTSSATIMASDMPFVNGPALIYDMGVGGHHASSSSSSGLVAVFGGNSILKALALVGNNYNGSTFNSTTIDEWLKYEQCILRPTLSSNVEDHHHNGDVEGGGKKNKKVLLEEALRKIESALSCNGGMSVIATDAAQHVVVVDLKCCTSPTPANVAIALTLSHYCRGGSGGRIGSGSDADNVMSSCLSPTIRSYVEMTTLKSDAYIAALALAKSLIPPPPPPLYDPNDPSLLNASSAIFAKAILSIFPLFIIPFDATP